MLATTRWVSIGIIPVLGAAFVILYWFPGRTADLWAWTIMPEMTAMFMGGGYLAGAWLFLRIATSAQGHKANVALVAVSVFTLLLLLATLFHWDRFNHDHVSFWAWLALYVVTPVLLPVLWFNNRRTDPGVPTPEDVVIPPVVRGLMTAGGALALIFALVMFVRPTLVLEEWPWTLTPLTARTLSAFIAFPAVAWMLFAVDRRWSSFEIPMETSIIGETLILVAAVRGWDDFKTTTDARVYTAILVVALLWLAGVYVEMTRRRVRLRG
jgi:hypothetical protein